MTDEEFVTACAGPLEAIYGPMDVIAIRMYRQFVGHLDRDVLAAATAKCIAESKWRPKPSELLEAAFAITQGQVQDMTAHEAWAFCQKAVRRIDFDIPGSIARAKALVPPLVWEAMEGVGLTTLVNATQWEARDVQRWFHDAFTGLLARERKLLIAPPSVRKEIEAHRQTMTLPIPEAVQRVAGSIGSER